MTTHYEKSSGNVFADLGMPNSEQELLKAQLTGQFFKLVSERSLLKATPRSFSLLPRLECLP
jgi:hypothetical protein